MKQYNIIYADPPWKYQGGQNLRGSPAKHYPVMTIDEICALPVSKFTADDCVLFLWVTYPKLEEAFQVIKAWGFTYKTVAFTWIKQTKKAGSGLWDSAFGRGTMRKSACSPPKAGRKETPLVCASLSYRPLKNTVRSPILYGTG